MKTMGEFIDLLVQSENQAGVEYLQWTLGQSEDGYACFCTLPSVPFDKVGIQKLALSLASVMWSNINGTGNEEFHAYELVAAHDFFRDIHARAVKCGIDISLHEVNQPISPFEMLAAANGLDLFTLEQLKVLQREGAYMDEPAKSSKIESDF